MARPAERLPGVYFESATPVRGTTLPRMDIGMFVGFATTGPLHTPVAIETPQQLRDVFGPDLGLAWDGERGGLQFSQLGASVESFLQNGGVRCWVVRVADESLAQTAAFLVPRLIRTRQGSRQDATAVARCAGSWADTLGVRALLDVRSLRAAASLSSHPAWEIADDGWSVRVAAPPEAFETGELISLEITPDTGSPAYTERAMLVVDRVTSTAEGTQLQGRRGYWLLDDEPAAIAAVDADVRPLSASSTLGLEQNAEDRAGASVSIGRLRLELQAWTSGTLTHRLRDLGFAPEHPRFWGSLPTDDVLYRGLLPDADNRQSRQALFDEAASPRFPIAADPAAGDTWDYLPIAMPVQVGSADLAAAIVDSGVSRRERNGLGEFSADLFIDADLSWYGADMLLQQALSRTSLANNPQPLRGVHNALLVEEATLIAAPDALHRHWESRLPAFAAPLQAPQLHGPEPASTEREIRLSWTGSAGARSYTIEVDHAPSFTAPRRHVVGGEILPLAGEQSELLAAPATDTAVRLDRDGVYFLRVRAEKAGVVSAWSNTRVLIVPHATFFDCDSPSPQSMELQLDIDASPASPAVSSPGAEPALVWRFVAATVPGVDGFELEEAATLSFSGASIVHETSASAFPVSVPLTTARFYRVRATAGGSTGPWSNTVVLPAGLASDVSLVPPADFINDDLLAVQRSIARICSARGDLLGILSVPEHYRVADVVDHSSALTGAGPGTAGFSRVRPLSSGERNALTHLALFYPWLVNRGESGTAGVVDNRRLPPEGSVTGMIARRTLAQGAWIAPANEAFVDTLAVTDDTAADSMTELSASRVNVVLQTPRAFLTLSETTLSTDSEWRTIHVRRLLHLLRRLVLREGNRFVFEPNNGPFRDRVRRYFTGVLNDFYARGALAGRSAEEAFRVVVDDTVNDARSIDRGRLIVELHVAPSAALRFIRVRLVQTGPAAISFQEQSR